MPSKINVVGVRFGRLLVLRDGDPVAGRRRVVCRCDCGTIKAVDPRALRAGHARSCGCLQREVVSRTTPLTHTTHGQARSAEYGAWVKMKMRCFNVADAKFPDYGGRGITVCEEWRDDFAQFFADMGSRPTPDHSLDRIDVNGNYEPRNCRWADAKAQSRNKRNHRLVEWGGELVPLSVACEASGVNYRSALYRLNVGKDWQPLPAAPPPPGGQG